KLVLLLIFAIIAFPQIAESQSPHWRMLIAKDTYDVWVNPHNYNTIFVGGGGRTLYRSYDAGVTWDTLVIGFKNATSLFNNVLIHPNDTNVVICGGLNFGSIRRSTDHGDTWETVLDDPIGKISLNGKAMMMKPGGEDTLYIGEFRSARIFRSTDRGATWDSIGVVGHIEQIEDENGNPKDTLMPNEIACMGIRSDSTDVLLMGGTNSIVFISTDGGHTWNVTDTLRTPDMLLSDSEITRIVFSNRDPRVGYAVITYLFGFNKNNGGLHKTTDGGYSWDLVAFPDTSMWAAAVRGYGDVDEVFIGGYTEDFYAPDSMRIAGVGIVRRSQDGGKTWWSYDPGINWYLEKATLNSVFFVSDVRGYIVGDRAKIFRSSDGGMDWHQQATYFSNDLNGLYFTNDSVGYAVGSDGMIAKTINRASFYEPMESNTEYDLYSVWFTSWHTGYVCGDYGTILKTTNAGETWNHVYDLDDTFFRSIRFFGEDIAVACGLDGVIMRTTDAGETWQKMNSSTEQDLFSIFMVNQDIGYACGYQSLVLKTTDGGGTWLDASPEVPLYEDYNLNALWFTSEDVGVVCGAKGRVWRTTDGGESWTRSPLTSKLDIQSTFFVNENLGFIASQNQEMWRTSDGGLSWSRVNGYGARANMWSMRYFGHPGQEKLYMASEAGCFVLDYPSPVRHEVEESIKPRLSVRANDGIATINYFSGLPNPEARIRIEIADMSGRIVHSSEINKFGDNVETTISLGEIPTGAYLCRVVEAGVMSVEKIILK
ncbi:MAG: YCF48-related protein, partial [Candidatus Kapaibacterium sp.]